MRWAHLITPMCQILNVVITSCISFVLVYFYYLMSCYLCRFPVLVMIVCGQMKRTFCSKPRTTRCTPRRNRFETVRQNIFIFLRGRSFSIFTTRVCSLILNLWMPQNERKIKEDQTKSEHSCFIAREELKKRELSSCIGHFGLFEDLGQASCPRGTTSQVSSRLLWNIFSNLRAKLSS